MRPCGEDVSRIGGWQFQFSDLHVLSVWPDPCRFITSDVLGVFGEWKMCSTCVDPCALSSTVKIYCFQKKWCPGPHHGLKSHLPPAAGFSPIHDKHENHVEYKEHALHLKFDTRWEPVKNTKQVKQVLKVSHVPFRLTQSLLKMLIWMMSVRNQLTID